jgi:sugar phosphate isomerase/epimerase
MWERCVRWFRAAPGALLEPWAGAVVHSAETMQAFAAEVPGQRFLVDTGHVADWGGDPEELLAWADHVQLRQGAPGRTQLHVDDPGGVVDFAAVLRRLGELGYRGRLSVEHFDIPDMGWGLDDPIAWARDLRARIRAL